MIARHTLDAAVELRAREEKQMIPEVKAKLLEGKRGLIVASPTISRSPGAAPRLFGHWGRSLRSPISMTRQRNMSSRWRANSKQRS